MRKEIPPYLIVLVLVVVVGVVVAFFLWTDPVRRAPVVRIGPNEVFDMKTGKAVPADAVRR